MEGIHLANPFNREKRPQGAGQKLRSIEKREADEAKRLAERKSRGKKRALLRYELASRRDIRT